MPWLSLHSVYFMERLQGYVHQRWGMKRAGWVRAGPGSRGLQPNYIQFSLCHQLLRLLPGAFGEALLSEEKKTQSLLCLGKKGLDPS